MKDPVKDTEMRRVAVVTGASRGLGAVVARLLARRGFDLVLSARLPSEELEAVAADARGAGSRVRVVTGDLVYERTREALVQASASFGGVDLLLNNASELGGIGPLAEVSLERLERLWRVNVLAPLALTRVLLPLISLRRGVVVNVSSDAAQGAYAGWGGYGSTKAALELISRTLATELIDRGVSVLSVDPGDMRTRMHQEAFPGEDISDRPLPDITLPFFEWLVDHLGDAAAINGARFQAQAEDERWAVRV